MPRRNQTLEKLDEIEHKMNARFDELVREAKFEIQAFLTVGFASGVLFISLAIIIFKLFLK